MAIYQTCGVGNLGVELGAFESPARNRGGPLTRGADGRRLTLEIRGFPAAGPLDKLGGSLDLSGIHFRARRDSTGSQVCTSVGVSALRQPDERMPSGSGWTAPIQHLHHTLRRRDCLDVR
jgi:hypothetical protein